MFGRVMWVQLSFRDLASGRNFSSTFKNNRRMTDCKYGNIDSMEAVPVAKLAVSL